MDAMEKEIALFHAKKIEECKEIEKVIKELQDEIHKEEQKAMELRIQLLQQEKRVRDLHKALKDHGRRKAKMDDEYRIQKAVIIRKYEDAKNGN